jgi:hypothetical protein
MPLYYYWLAYAELEPFGQARGDLMIARQTAELLNTMVALWSKRRGKRLTAEDFLFDFGSRFKEKKKKTPQEMYGLIRTAALLGGAKDPKAANVSGS